MKLSKKDFLDMPFAVKSDMASGHKADIDESRRTVDLVANTYYYYDSYGDVLIEGCCAKSIKDRGPKSDNPGKIKHFANHAADDGIARVDMIEEATINSMHVLHGNSWMSESINGEQYMIKYREGLIDQHSIGFNYLTLTYLESESEEFDKLLAKLINPDDAIKGGFMWAVNEIKLFEYSSLDGFGANRLTPFLGVKTDNKQVQYNNLITKLDALHIAMRSGGEKETLQLQERQIKQMIYELYNPEPSSKDTPPGPPKDDTFDVGKAIQTLNFN